MHLVEVEAAGQDTVYRLMVGGDIPGASSLAEVRAELGLPAQEGVRGALPQGVQLPLADKERPLHPLTLGTPYGLIDAESLPGVPPSPAPRHYLPLVYRNG